MSLAEKHCYFYLHHRTLFNLSLFTGRVSDAWKVSHVIPIFLRPVTPILPPTTDRYISTRSVPNCWKKITHRNILEHLVSNGILTKRQFGFLPRSSTSDALITGSNEDRKSIVMTLFDLSKAFEN